LNQPQHPKVGNSTLTQQPTLILCFN